jgi:hypothetical protein
MSVPPAPCRGVTQSFQCDQLAADGLPDYAPIANQIKLPLRLLPQEPETEQVQGQQREQRYFQSAWLGIFLPSSWQTAQSRQPWS